MAIVAFSLRHDDVLQATQIVPIINGCDLTDLIHAFEREHGMEQREVSYAGLYPAHFRFGPLADYFLGRPVPARDKIALLGCNCGEWGCWPLLARITVAADNVSWTDFEQPYRKQRDYRAFGPFTFARDQYQAALADLELTLTG